MVAPSPSPVGAEDAARGGHATSSLLSVTRVVQVPAGPVGSGPAPFPLMRRAAAEPLWATAGAGDLARVDQASSALDWPGVWSWMLTVGIGHFDILAEVALRG